MKFRFIINFILLTAVIFSGGCKKINQGAIIGKWQYINMYTNQQTRIEEVWEFTKSDNLYVYQKFYEGQSNELREERTMMGKYKVVWSVNKTIVKVTDLNEGIWNVNWQILKMNENALMLYSNVSSNYLLKEFEKIK